MTARLLSALIALCLVLENSAVAVLTGSCCRDHHAAGVRLYETYE